MPGTGGEAEGVQLVVMAATVTRAPVDLGADDRRTGSDFAAAGEGPENGTGAGVQRVHIGPRTGVGTGVDDAVSHAYIPGIGRRLRIRGLPQDRPGGRVDGRPGSAGDGLPRVGTGSLERVWRLVGVGFGAVNAGAVGGRSPEDPAPGTAGPDFGTPHEIAGCRVQRPVIAALLARSDQLLSGAGDRVGRSDQVWRGGEIVIRAAEGLAGAVIGICRDRGVIPGDRTGAELQRQDGVEVVSGDRRLAVLLIGLLAGPGGHRVVIAGRDVKQAGCRIHDRGRAPDRSTGVVTRQ